MSPAHMLKARHGGSILQSKHWGNGDGGAWTFLAI